MSQMSIQLWLIGALTANNRATNHTGQWIHGQMCLLHVFMVIFGVTIKNGILIKISN